MDTKTSVGFSHWFFIGGFISIFASILLWFKAEEPDRARGERLGIFVGLWAPTFFILSERFARSEVEQPVKTSLLVDETPVLHP